MRNVALLWLPLLCRLRVGRADSFLAVFKRPFAGFCQKEKPPSLPPVFFKQKLSRPCELLRSVSTVALSLGNWLSEVARELLEVSLLLIKWNSWIGNRFQILCDSSSFLHNLCDSKASSAMCLCSSPWIQGNQGLGTHTWSPSGHCHSTAFAFPGAQNVNNAHGAGFPTAACLGSSLCSDPVNIVSLRAEHHLYVPPINEVMVQIPYTYEVLVWKIIIWENQHAQLPYFLQQGKLAVLIYPLKRKGFFLHKSIFSISSGQTDALGSGFCQAQLQMYQAVVHPCLQGNEYGLQQKLFWEMFWSLPPLETGFQLRGLASLISIY